MQQVAMNNGPVMFDQMQLHNYFNLQPSRVKGRCNADTELHKRYLYTKLYSVLEFTLPEYWPINWFRFWLFNYGSIACIYTKEFGWTVQPYGVEKLDLYYQPSEIIVWNHLFNDVKKGKIGVNAEIIHLMDDYYGIDDLVTKYAVQLAQIDKDINVNLMNCNLSMIAEVENDKRAAEVKTAYGKATEGNPLVVVNKNLDVKNTMTNLFPAVKQTYIADQLLSARRNLINQFLTDIGIRNFNMDKKAQQNDTEITENNDETKAIISVILENLQKAFTKINRLSGLSLSVKLRYEYGGDDYGANNPMGDVSVRSDAL